MISGTTCTVLYATASIIRKFKISRFKTGHDLLHAKLKSPCITCVAGDLNRQIYKKCLCVSYLWAIYMYYGRCHNIYQYAKSLSTCLISSYLKDTDMN